MEILSLEKLSFLQSLAENYCFSKNNVEILEAIKNKNFPIIRDALQHLDSAIQYAKEQELWTQYEKQYDAILEQERAMQSSMIIKVLNGCGKKYFVEYFHDQNAIRAATKKNPAWTNPKTSLIIDIDRPTIGVSQAEFFIVRDGHGRKLFDYYHTGYGGGVTCSDFRDKFAWNAAMEFIAGCSKTGYYINCAFEDNEYGGMTSIKYFEEEVTRLIKFNEARVMQGKSILRLRWPSEEKMQKTFGDQLPLAKEIKTQFEKKFAIGTILPSEISHREDSSIPVNATPV